MTVQKGQTIIKSKLATLSNGSLKELAYSVQDYNNGLAHCNLQ